MEKVYKRQFIAILLANLLFSATSWGQAWKLTETMTATLDDKGVLTISTTKDAEAMPDMGFNIATNHAPWFGSDVHNRSVRSVIIENGVTSIGGYSFSNHWALTSVEIPNSVTTIGQSAFNYCMALASVTIPNSVTTIGEYAFHVCHSLQSLTIPQSVTTIGKYAFAESDITTVTIPNSVTAIGASAFSGCRFLTDVTIPNSITAIEAGTFAQCSSLTSVTIPNSVTTIEDAAFHLCTSLTSVTIPNSVITLGAWVFSECLALSSVEIPNSVTTIGEYAFNSCVELTSITIPNAVTSIGKGAFIECLSLTSITIPKSATNLGNAAFAQCTSLKDVSVEWTTPLPVDIYFFDEVILSAAILHVPTGTKALYQAADGWKDFGTILEYNPSHTEPVEVPTLKAYASNGILTVSGLQAGEPVSIYSLSGQLVYKGVAKAETEQIPLNVNGIYIVATKNRTIKTIIKY